MEQSNLIQPGGGHPVAAAGVRMGAIGQSVTTFDQRRLEESGKTDAHGKIAARTLRRHFISQLQLAREF